MMRGIIRISLLTAALVFTIASGPAQDFQPRVNLRFESLPQEIVPGRPFQVSASYQSNLHEVNVRFVAILRLKGSPDGPPLKRVVLDNDGRGYDSADGVLQFDCVLEEKIAPELYFELYLCPYGMNGDVLEMLRSYPTDGTHPYKWVSGSTGHTRDLFYLDRLLFKGQKDGSTYCCGLTYEVFLRTFHEYYAGSARKRIGELDFSEMKKMRGEWYGSWGDKDRQMVSVIDKKNLGTQLDDLNRARPGDFIQFWRYNKSGHSAIFLGWEADQNGRATHLNYWSAQKSTNGINFNRETVGAPGGVNLKRTYIARLKKPRDEKDWERRFGSAPAPAPVPVR